MAKYDKMMMYTVTVKDDRVSLCGCLRKCLMRPASVSYREKVRIL